MIKELGRIVRLQVQVTSLKVGQPPQKRYDPAGIQLVQELELSSDGVLGYGNDGSAYPDVHHRLHPQTKNRAGTNGISICFTSHYDLMRRRFGEHVTDGIAGENILVQLSDSSEVFTEEAFEGGITIRKGDGNAVELTDVHVAAPCVEFSRWALQFPNDERPDRSVSEALIFLNEGTRGFYASYSGEVTRVRIGDLVYIAG